VSPERLRPAYRLGPEMIAELSGSSRVFTEQGLRSFLNGRRRLWAAVARNSERVLEELGAHPSLKLLHIQSEVRSHTRRYTWGIVSPYAVALSLAPKGYLSHRTALGLHQVMPEDYEPIYVNREQSPKTSSTEPLAQANVARAFAGKPRVSRDRYRWLGAAAVVISGKFTGRLEVTSIFMHDVASLERTLIDVAVRPAYGGGPAVILEAYARARDRVDVARMAEVLEAMDYVYPYHQCVGFYLERAQYPASHLRLFRTRSIDIDFYLAHGLNQPRFDPHWRIYYPGDLM
jgi:hypothetical protein